MDIPYDLDQMTRAELEARVRDLEFMLAQERRQRHALHGAAEALVQHCWTEVKPSTGTLIRLTRTCGDVLANEKNIVRAPYPANT